MPKPLIYTLAVLAALTLLPLAYLALVRSTDSPLPRIQVVFDMDSQPRYGAQTTNDFFADGLSARVQVPGTVAFGEAGGDEAYQTGKRDTTWVTRLPVAITAPLLERGRERFNIICSSCHGLLGDGNSLVHERARGLGEGTWSPPTDLTSAATIDRADGELFDFITNGVRKMPAYGPQVPVADRWAIVAYIRALQRRATGTLKDVPEDQRSNLR